MAVEIKIIHRNKMIAAAALFVTMIMPVIGYFGVPMPVFQNEYKAGVIKLHEENVDNKIDILNNSIRDLKKDREDYVLQKLHVESTIEQIKRDTGKEPSSELTTLEGTIDNKLTEIDYEILEKKRILSQIEERKN